MSRIPALLALEASVRGHVHHLSLGGRDAFLSARRQSLRTVDGGGDGSDDGRPGGDGDITVEPCDRIPRTPRNILKAFGGDQPHPKIVVSVDFSAVRPSDARGNENNQDPPDGVYSLGRGFLAGRWRAERRGAASGAKAHAVVRRDG